MSYRVLVQSVRKANMFTVYGRIFMILGGTWYNLVNTRTSNSRASSELENQFSTIKEARAANSCIFRASSESEHKGHQAFQCFCNYYPKIISLHKMEKNAY